MEINIDKKVLRYFFVLATIAILFPPFRENNVWLSIQFSFLLDPPRRSDGVSMSLLTVEIIASFLIAHIINFVSSETPKKYLYGVPIFLIFLAVSVGIYEKYEKRLIEESRIEQDIERGIELAERENSFLKDENFKKILACNALFDKSKEEKKVSGESITESYAQFIWDLECPDLFPYIFGNRAVIDINQHTTREIIKNQINNLIISIKDRRKNDIRLTPRELDFLKSF